MSNRSQVIEIIRLVTLLMGGLGAASANAQAPTFSPPTLPPIPGAPSMPANAVAPIPGGPGIVSPPALETDRPANPSSPALSDLTALPSTNALAANELSRATAPPADDALADLPPPIAPESGDVVAGAGPAIALPEIAPPEPVANPATVTQPTSVPPIAEPIAEPTKQADAAAKPGPVVAPPALVPPPTIVTTLPAIDLTGGRKDEAAAETAAAEAPKVKTWQTRLAPVSTAYTTKYNYRRVLMPGALYRTQYDRANDHLPTRITREDYVRLLFASAARNDINATRALLNAGTDLNARNPHGETALQVARRYGAIDTAALLQARGAR